MRELMLGWAITSPGAFIFVGRFVVYVGGALGLLGLRFDRLGDRVERISARAGVAMPDMLAALPWWLRMVVPETAIGWMGLVVYLALGACLVYFGKWARRIRG